MYDAIHMLPQRRMEYYFAQLTLQVVGAAGGKAKLNDFLFDDVIKSIRQARSHTNVAEESAAVLGAMSGKRKIVKIGQKRKRYG